MLRNWNVSRRWHGNPTNDDEISDMNSIILNPIQGI